MPVLLGAAYLVGLYGLVSLAYTAGRKKAERNPEFGADFDPKARSWWLLLVHDGKRYRWIGPRHLNFSERLDWSMSQPISYRHKSAWEWTGTKWIPEDSGVDPRYGQRLA